MENNNKKMKQRLILNLIIGIVTVIVGIVAIAMALS